MPENIAFHIKNLYCEYIEGKPVLSIPDLVIPKGKLVFVLGISGIGKSTFIETLGLMNKTIADRSDCHIMFNEGKDDLIDISDIWKDGNLTLSDFRNKHFSFIFQNTNLMPNFTAGQNMCISQLIEGKSFEESRPLVENVMKRLDLDPELFDRKVQELSGGQRQRLAFVRAITAGFKVLFGDEPTGNLDQNTSYKLMGILKENLVELQNTGVVVSHDIGLSLKFADVIVLLTKTKHNDQDIGISVDDYYLEKSKDEWNFKDGRILENPRAFISDLLNN